ncbi:MAG: DUF2953 domain-containing protein [Bacillota bacterium]
MGWVIAGLLLGLLTLGALLLPVRLALALRQSGWQVNLHLQVRYGFLRLERAVDVTENVAMALEHLWKRWRTTGEPVKPDLQETVRRAPSRRLVRAALPALRPLGRATRCHRLHLRMEVGGGDAMESALLAGALWGSAGMLVGLVSRTVRLSETAAAVAVVPNFRQPIWRIEADCILTVRLGKAIMAIVGLLRRAASRKEVIAWVRDSLQRKGDQSSGRPSDSGPDEDGYGKP